MSLCEMCWLTWPGTTVGQVSLCSMQDDLDSKSFRLPLHYLIKTLYLESRQSGLYYSGGIKGT